MPTLKASSILLFRRAVRTFQYYPASMLSAIGFAMVTIIRIHLDWQDQEAYNFLFNCLHWTFSAGAIVGLSATAVLFNQFHVKHSQHIVSLVTLVTVLVSFSLLYFFGATEVVEASRYQRLSYLSTQRMIVLLYTSMLLFVLFSGRIFEDYDFSAAFFMTHKAFFIAIVYGLVLLAGLTAIAGAIETLLYADMSNKVYMYLSTMAGFLTFMLLSLIFQTLEKK